MANFRSSRPFALALVFFLAGSVGAAAQTGEFPFGSYQGGPFTFTFEEGGAFRVVHSSGAGVTGTYKISDDQIEFTDQYGDLVCQGSMGSSLQQGSTSLESGTGHSRSLCGSAGCRSFKTSDCI